VHIPATGPEGFLMGAKGIGGAPERRVVLTRPFCMDATEVTVAAYKACVDAGTCKPPRTWGVWINYPTKLDHPVNKIGWRSARAYCQQRGQDLPTEAQWEWAATGGDGRPWPWGAETPTCEHADFTAGLLEGPASNDGCRGGGTSPVGSTPRGARRWPGGELHDLAGNVWEWTLDSYAPNGNIPKGTPATDPVVTLHDVGPHVTRGGGWNRSGKGIRAQYRAGSPVDYQVPGLGFRCVRDLGPA
jgi:formylglycine-generating enzyme required for sulfatase activity